MTIIPLQELTKRLDAQVESYWFENEDNGLKNTQYHRISIPLSPFNSGLSYMQQPENTRITVEWIDLRLDNPADLGGIVLKSETHPQMEASIYLGLAHNWIEVNSISIAALNDQTYSIDFKLLVDLETEGVGQNTEYSGSTRMSYFG